MKTITSLLTATALTATIAAPAFAETWDMPLAYPATNFHSAVAAEFGKCVTTGTGGDITIATHPSGSLIAGNDIKRAIQTGQVPIGERLMSAHQNENAVFGFDSIPFLATSFDDSAKLWEAAEPTLKKLLAEQDLTLLYTVPWPPQGIYFKTPINAVSEMSGIKFRAYNAATARLAELTGMLPVQIEAAELSQALATGVADSMISSAATGYDSKLWESLNYFYEVDAWLPRNYIMVNSGVWEGLSEENRSIVTGCAELAEYAGNWRAREYTGFTLQGLRDGGMTVEPASDTLKSDLQAIGETMTTEWLDAAGEDGRAIVEAYRAMK